MSKEREIHERPNPREQFSDAVGRFDKLQQKPTFSALLRNVLSITFEGFYENGENHYEYETKEVEDSQCVGIILQEYKGGYSQMMYVYDHQARLILNCHVTKEGLPIIERDKHGNNRNTSCGFGPDSQHSDVLHAFQQQVSRLEAHSS